MDVTNSSVAHPLEPLTPDEANRLANACQSLLNFDCDIALAGGVAGNFPQCHSRIHEEGGMISGDGHCRPQVRCHPCPIG